MTKEMPKRQTRGSAGADLRASESVTLAPGSLTPVSTGYIYHVEGTDTVGLVRGRSGLAFKHGILAYEGTIDSDYVGGEVKVLLHNTTSEPFRIEEGDRIGQIVIAKCLTPVYYEYVDQEREAKGFGSTGVK